MHPGERRPIAAAGRARRAAVALFVGLLLAGSAVTGVAAQQPSHDRLNEHCTISILNRTAQVRPDGTWRIDNVPANFGPVRARATCVESGVTRSGQSGFLTIQAGAITGFDAAIRLGLVDPVPESLTVTAPSTTLNAIGATTQLGVTATLPGGGSRDVSTAALGTAYTTSSDAVASVGPDGLVTAVASGTAIISATNEGALGLTVVRVLASTDADGDGIPDDVELANGLSPTDPVDALEDVDDDWLSNKQELVDYGTGLRVPDSDGDGVSDGLEVQTQSDPNNPSSLNLAQALRSLSVSPANFILTVNTVVGEASRQLTVGGQLKDGRSIDLTGRPAVAYSSSDLAVCNFGETPGQLFAGADGSCTVTAAVGTLSAPARGTVRSFAPTALSFVTVPGDAQNVDVRGRFAYVAAGPAGLQVVDLADRRAPAVVAALATTGYASDVRVVGNRAYVAAGAAGLHVVDVADPTRPSLVTSLDTPGDAQDLAVKGSLVFVADGSAGLQIVDLGSDAPPAPRLVGSVAVSGHASGVAVADDRAIAVVAGQAGLSVVDVADPTRPAVLGTAAVDAAQDVALAGGFAFVASGASSLTSVDLSDPASPRVHASTPRDTGGLLEDVEVVGRFAFGADVFFVNGVPIVDVSPPAGPVPRAILDFSSYRDDDGTGIAVDANYLYLTARAGDSRLYVGQYLALEDRAGVAPTVRITSPLAGATVVEGARVPITVEAADDVGVAAVTFLVGDSPVGSDDAAPYRFELTVPSGVGSLTLGATAIDFGDNAASASTVRVDVVPDPLTTVVGRVVDRAGAPVAGATVSTADGRSAISGADGRFSIAGVPTVRGDIVVTAGITVDGVRQSGSSTAVPPVLGGTTEVPPIVVIPAQFESDVGELVIRCDDCWVARALPFPFTFFGRSYTTVYVNSNGNVTFGSGDAQYWETIEDFARLPRISPFWDDLITTEARAGVFVNDQLPGRFVVTWSHIQEYCCYGDSTIQLVLFDDGRIQFAYNGVSAPDSIVGLTPSVGLTPGGVELQQVDFSNRASFSTPASTGVLEQFGAFDLDRSFLLFAPNGDGGFDVQHVRMAEPPPGGQPTATPSATPEGDLALLAGAIGGDE